MKTPVPASSDEPQAAGGRATRSCRLLWEADPLLAVVPQLRAAGHVADVAELNAELAALLRDFQVSARTRVVQTRRIGQATQVLAALIDQVVASMPWGADANWRSLSATAARPGEPGPVEPPGQRLLAIARESSGDPGMRELVAVALALGFQSADDAYVAQVRAELGGPDRQYLRHAGRETHTDRELSPQWRSPVQRRSALGGWLPLWVSSLGALAALAALYLGLELSLASKSDQLYARMAALKMPAATAAQPLPASTPRLAGLLADQVAGRELSVRDEIDRSVIVVPGSELFEPGGTTLRPAATPLVRAIAAALERSPGRIELIGHTDGALTYSARYPSDWDFSVERAHALEESLRGLGIRASRLAYDGRAGLEPLRAEGGGSSGWGDGRVEIVLLAGR